MVTLPADGADTPPARLTPAMAQFQAIKAKYPDAILLFRIGDFYETFGHDAETVSRELDIVLTSRSRDSGGNKIPLAGVPHHAVDGYIRRLIEKGYKVAVCDQMEDARNSKGIVKRDVVRVITPGTVIDESMVTSQEASYLMALAHDEKGRSVGMAFLDISTGEFFVSQSRGERAREDVLSGIARYRPRECVISGHAPASVAGCLEANGVLVSRYRADIFDTGAAGKELLTQFGVSTLEGFGISEYPAAVRAAGAVLRYALETQKASLSHITGISVRRLEEALVIDSITLRNLELLDSLRGSGESTLFHVLNLTRTPMGARLLRSYLITPLVSVEKIRERLDAVEFFLQNSITRAEVRQVLKKCADIERIAGRIAYGNAGPRDLLTLAASLSTIPHIKSLFPPQDHPGHLAGLFRALEGLKEKNDVVHLLQSAIVDDPPAVAKSGGVIRGGYDSRLDDLKAVSSSAKDWMVAFQQKERDRTGIKSLKISYNAVFGYYIEVTRPNLRLIPPGYERKQTTSTGERFTIPELKEKEAIISNADEKLLSLENELFLELLGTLKEHIPDFKSIAAGIALLDIYQALAEVADKYGYVRPVVDDSEGLLIRDCRHPVVEQRMKGGYVPNDVEMSARENQILIITGANMAGKSTYMRSVALAAVMAQMGSYVPATFARIGVFDRIFTRVGAFDDLASGQSTFMVEMLELANILNNFSSKSLVILDEIGRGTSTMDGFCIAQAVLEYLHGKGNAGPRTLFATHFHNLVGMEAVLKRVRNFHFAVKDTGKEVVFLRKLIPGATDRSYGIHVASLAGIPGRVTERANQLLREMMQRSPQDGRTVRQYTQMLLIDSPEPGTPEDPVVEELKSLDTESMTPLQALQKLYDIRDSLRKRGA